MPAGRPPAHPLPTNAAAVCAPIVWVRTLDYRTPSEQLGRRLSYSQVRPVISRSWRLAVDTAEPPAAPGPTPADGARLYKRGGRLSAALIEMRWRFGGDLDQYLIYLIVMLAELDHDRAAHPAGGDGPAQPTSAPRGLNAFSVAEITRIPRETVRRKLGVMVGRGHVRRGEDGLYYPGPRTNLDRFFVELNRLF